jgi:hypothetical protein
VGELRASRHSAGRELRLTIDDSEALAWLAQYYAAKFRGACALGLYDLAGDARERDTAVRELEAALARWKRYAAVRDANHVPALYNRLGRVDVTALTARWPRTSSWREGGRRAPSSATRPATAPRRDSGGRRVRAAGARR